MGEKVCDHAVVEGKICDMMTIQETNGMVVWVVY